MPNATLDAAVNTAVADAKSLPQLITTLQTVSPALAQQLTGKSALLSKTPWGTTLITLIAYASSRFGLGWDQDTCALVALLAVFIGSAIMRLFTKAPITSILPAATPAAPVPAPVPMPMPVDTTASQASAPPSIPVSLPLVLVASAALMLSACDAQQLASTKAAIGAEAAKAHLYCSVATAAGPLTVALVSASDPAAAPVAVTTAEAVQYACSLVNGIPVSPPAAGTVAPIVAVPGNLPTVPKS
jgi:hypothetical protein